ncbi:hypothetical protein ACJX0J_011515, partial [Zea mays]
RAHTNVFKCRAHTNVFKCRAHTNVFKCVQIRAHTILIFIHMCCLFKKTQKVARARAAMMTLDPIIFWPANELETIIHTETMCMHIFSLDLDYRMQAVFLNCQIRKLK